MSIMELTKDNYEKEVLNSEKPVLLDFWGPTCRPCMAMHPSLEIINTNYGERIKVAKVNAEKEQDLFSIFKVQGVPTLLILKNGKIADRKTGYQQTSQLKEWVEQHIGQ
jgi:thioredoxin 1